MLPAQVNPDFRSEITQMEAQMKALAAQPEHSINLATRHYFAPGLYAREITIPAGVELIGKIHRAPHINVVSQGRILVITEEGEREICAPCTFVAPAGTKRAGRALEDTVWTTFHANPHDEHDVAQLEDELIAPSFEVFDRERMYAHKPAIRTRAYVAIAVFYGAIAALAYLLWRLWP